MITYIKCKTVNFDSTCSYESYDIRSLSGQTGHLRFPGSPSFSSSPNLVPRSLVVSCGRSRTRLVVSIAIDFTEVAKDARSIILESKKLEHGKQKGKHKGHKGDRDRKKQKSQKGEVPKERETR